MLEEFQTEMTKDGGVVYGEGYNDEKEVVPILQDESPTQTQFPLKAVLRTIVAYLVGLGLTWVARQVPGVESILAQLTQPLIEAITNGVAVALAGFITWLMARPKINEFLTKLGLGAKPKYAA